MGTWGHHNAEMGTCGRGDMLVRLGPGGVTFGVIGSSCFWKCVKLLAEQLWRIWRRYALPFFRYLRKT